jgi:hypothetical protein
VPKNTIKRKLKIPETAIMTTRYLLKCRVLVKYDLSIGMIKWVNYLKGGNHFFLALNEREKTTKKLKRKYTRKEWFLLKDETQTRNKLLFYLSIRFFLFSMCDTSRR